MIVLGVDYGEKRVGLATGDTGTKMSFPLRTLPHAGDDVAMAVQIASVARAEEADQIVVGMPVRMTGDIHATPGETEEQVIAFISILKTKTALPVFAEDERMSSAQADSLVRGAGGNMKHFDRDAMAAAAILETYLARWENRADNDELI